MLHPQHLITDTMAGREHETAYRGDARRPHNRPQTRFFRWAFGGRAIVAFWLLGIQGAETHACTVMIAHKHQVDPGTLPLIDVEQPSLMMRSQS
jgi:hypothetical protein